MTDPWPRWMTVDTCARYIDRSPDAVRTLVHRGAIPFHRVGQRLTFGREELDAWVLSGGSVLGSPHITEPTQRKRA